MRALSLTHDLIRHAHREPIADDHAAMHLLTDQELAGHLEVAFAKRRHPDADLWLFAYGSLMWKPDLEFAERRLAAVKGWHRRFCLWQWRYRGTRDRPGIMLALDRGGSCRGVAYRLGGPDLRGKIAPVWRREMTANGYRPRWVTAYTDDGAVTALVFVAHRAGERYAGRLPDAAIAIVSPWPAATSGRARNNCSRRSHAAKSLVSATGISGACRASSPIGFCAPGRRLQGGTAHDRAQARPHA